MNKHNTILGQMTALISRSHFEKLVKEHKTERNAGPKGYGAGRNLSPCFSAN